jgi:hypothetical protein
MLGSDTVMDSSRIKRREVGRELDNVKGTIVDASAALDAAFGVDGELQVHGVSSGCVKGWDAILFAGGWL